MMGIISGLFRSRDKPENRTAGSAYTFYMGGSTSGKAVTERTAMQMTAVYSCVRILAEAVAGLPLHLYKYNADGGKEKALDHPLYRLLHDEPNPEMSSFVFRETLMTHLLLWGNAYAQVIRNGKNEVIALYPLMPNKMSVDRDENGHLYYTYYRGSDEAIKNKEFAVTLQPSDVLHIPGQVLHCPYKADKAKLVLREMADSLVLDLVEKGLVTDQIVVTIGYDIENLTDPERRKKYHGDIVKDHYGRQIPKHSHGTINLDGHTSSTRKILSAVSELFDRIVDKNLLIRRVNICANHVVSEVSAPNKNAGFEQLDLFTDYAARQAQQEQEKSELEREKKMQQAMLTIKKRFGKNAILKGMNLEEGATAKDRNAQIGGHKA
jgi:hypothetical protein